MQPRYTLKEIRSIVRVRDGKPLPGRTQEDIAGRIGCHQVQISKLEHRGDRTSVAHLRRYIEACGGKLELLAIVGGKRYVLDV